MHPVIAPIVYALFFLSGASALVYQVVWFRSLQLLLGGSHLAVTVVLSVFMGGLALGSHLIGKRIPRFDNLLKTYGLLETGIAGFAVVFILLMKIYPFFYVPLARVAEENVFFLSFFRVLFAVAAMIVPTTLMGGTLPVLTKLVSAQAGNFGERISFLYGFNTLGAVFGTMAAGFFLLPKYSVNVSQALAIATNASIGLGSILLSRWVASRDTNESVRVKAKVSSQAAGGGGSHAADSGYMSLPRKWVLWGIGISGFCALGYEVLWTRVLSMVVGASVYGFTVMLVAFLTGIALGSKGCGLLLRKDPSVLRGPVTPAILFGSVQVLIGLSALAVTYFLRDLPSHAIRIQNYLLDTGLSEFDVRQGANFVVAFSHMFVPALFMGFAFPLAGKIHSDSGKSAGEAIGEVLVYNTAGAILGAALSGFVLIYLFGIERSLLLLTIVNLGTGIIIVAGTRKSPVLIRVAAGTAAAAVLVLSAFPGQLKMWDTKYFAVYRNNTREAFSTSFGMKDTMENTDVLYYAEGVQATVSSIKVKGGYQAFITNGRIEASNRKEDFQCQFTLGHLPMLLHKKPKNVFVLGTGSGMTLGATSVHPGVEKIVLAEIEPKVIGVARTFFKYNHDVLDNPKLKVVINDGRNYLLTTKEKFDVITADPIHPWFSGAGYLYTTEYFRLAAGRLNPGGVVCQWLPIYELSVEDLKSVVRTFSENFRYTMLWLTRNDAELVGSNAPIVIDEKELGERISTPGIFDDLRSVDMGSADAFLSYFVMGTDGMRAFGSGGVINTDDNLHLEFSAPMSMDVPTQGRNAQALYRYRESLLPYLLPAKDSETRPAQLKKWDRYLQAGLAYAPVHVLFLKGGYETPEFQTVMSKLEIGYPEYAPLRFLKGEVEEMVSMNPTLIRAERFVFLDEKGGKEVVEISAVKAGVGKERAAVIFVENRARVIYGQRYIDAPAVKLERQVRDVADNVMNDIAVTYRKEVSIAGSSGKAYPLADPTLRKMKEIISSAVSATK